MTRASNSVSDARPPLQNPSSTAGFTLVEMLVVLVILSGLAALVSMMRTGIRTFWAPLEAIVPRVLVVEVAPILALLALCLAMAVGGGAIISYTDAAARSLHDPASYIEGVLGADVPGGSSR